MGELLEKLKANLHYDNNIWSVVHESEEVDELHFVLIRKYDQRVTRIIRPNMIKNTYCAVGIHLHDKRSYAKPTIVAESVYHDEKGNLYELQKDVFIKSIRRPIDLRFSDELYINSDEMKIYRKNQNKELQKALEYLYAAHTRSVKIISGFCIRIKYFALRKFIWRIPEAFSIIMRGILFLMNGSRFQKKTTTEIHLDELIGKKSELLKSGDGKEIDFMSIKVNAQSAFTYSILHLIFAYLYSALSFHSVFISKVANNVFLGLAYVVVSLTLWEKIIPRVLEKLIKRSAKVTYDLQFKPIKL